MLLALLLTFMSTAHAAPAARCEKAPVDFIEMTYGMNVDPAYSITTGSDGKVTLLFTDTGSWIYVITYTDESCTVLESHEHVDTRS